MMCWTLTLWSSNSIFLKLECLHLHPDSLVLICDVSLGHHRPFSSWWALLQGVLRVALSCTSRHPWFSGSSQTLLRLALDILWHTAQCRCCTPVLEMVFLEDAFTHVLVNIMGLLPCGASHLLTGVNHLARWREVFSLSGIIAEVFAPAFCLGWVARFGVSLMSDHNVRP